MSVARLLSLSYVFSQKKIRPYTCRATIYFYDKIIQNTKYDYTIYDFTNLYLNYRSSLIDYVRNIESSFFIFAER